MSECKDAARGEILTKPNPGQGSLTWHESRDVQTFGLIDVQLAYNFPMRIPREVLWCRRSTAWHMSFCLVVLAFLLRAVIPPGYMPTPPVQGGLPFAFTLCSGGAPAMAHAMHGGESQHDSQDHSQLFENCPFGLSLASKYLTTAGGLAVVAGLVYWFFFTPKGKDLLFKSPIPGPPVGRRAPPYGNLRSFQT